MREARKARAADPVVAGGGVSGGAPECDGA